MTSISLSFYLSEFQKHHDILTYEWLLEFAKKNGIEGGSAFRAIAGYGRHKNLHEQHFFELGSEVPLQVTFITEKSKALLFLDKIKLEKINLFYTLSEVELGFT